MIPSEICLLSTFPFTIPIPHACTCAFIFFQTLSLEFLALHVVKRAEWLQDIPPPSILPPFLPPSRPSSPMTQPHTVPSSDKADKSSPTERHSDGDTFALRHTPMTISPQKQNPPKKQNINKPQPKVSPHPPPKVSALATMTTPPIALPPIDSASKRNERGVISLLACAYDLSIYLSIAPALQVSLSTVIGVGGLERNVRSDRMFAPPSSPLHQLLTDVPTYNYLSLAAVTSAAKRQSL